MIQRKWKISENDYDLNVIKFCLQTIINIADPIFINNYNLKLTIIEER